MVGRASIMQVTRCSALVLALWLVLAGAALADKVTVYHLKDGRTVTGRRVAAAGDRLMVRQADGKTVIIKKAEIAKTEEKEVEVKPKPAAGKAEVPPELAAKLGKAVSLDFHGTPVADIMGFLQDFTGVNVVIDPRVGKKAVKLRVQNMPLRKALDAITAKAGCGWKLRGNAVFVASPSALKSRSGRPSSRNWASKAGPKLQKPVSLDFAQTPLRDVTTFLEQFSGVEIEVASNVRNAPITLKVSKMPLHKAIDFIAKFAGAKPELRGGKVYLKRRR